MIDLNVTPGHKSHLGLERKDFKGHLLDSILRESVHHLPFAILSDTCDNLVLDFEIDFEIDVLDMIFHRKANTVLVNVLLRIGKAGHVLKPGTPEHTGTPRNTRTHRNTPEQTKNLEH